MRNLAVVYYEFWKFSYNVNGIIWLIPQGCAQIISMDSQFLRNTYIFGFQITHTTFSRIFEPCLTYKNWLSVLTYPNENGELPECKKLHQFQNWSKQMEQSRLEFVPGIKNDEIEYYLLVYFLNSLQKWQLFIMTSKNLASSTRVCKNHFSGLSIFEKCIFGIQITHTNQPSTQHFHDFLSCFF